MITITNEIDKILENEGWIVECESPLEIRHEESNSFATGIAAETIIESILKENDNEDFESAKEFLLKLMNENKSEDYVIDYGSKNGRIEEYSLDKDGISGYDSSGNYTMINLDELDIKKVQKVQSCKTIFKSN